MLSAYILALAHPLVVAVIKLALPDVGVEAPFLMFLSAIVFVTAYGGSLPGLVATITSAGTATVYFLPPAGDAAPATTRDLGQLVVFGIEGMFIVAIVGALRRAAVDARSSGPHALSSGRG
jgi:K+-sensing histidine kinase KdpD